LLSCLGCDGGTETPSVPDQSVTIKIGETGGDGTVEFTDNSSGETVVVTVLDGEGQVLEGASVAFFDGDGFEAFHVVDIAGQHFPTLEIFPHNSSHTISLTPAVLQGFHVKEAAGPHVEKFVDWGSDEELCDELYYRTKEHVDSRTGVQMMILGQLIAPVYHLFSIMQDGLDLATDLGITEAVECYRDCWYFWEPGENLHGPFRITTPVEPSFCEEGGCSPECDGMDCGPDGCGASCGSCPSGQVCHAGKCSAGERFIDHGHSIVDLQEGLEWRMPCIAPYGGWNWAEAIDWCADLDDNGHSDWYLPSIDELAALLQAEPAEGCFIDAVFSNNGGWPCTEVWSATEKYPGYAQTVDFAFGQVRGNDTSFGNYTCCSRLAP